MAKNRFLEVPQGTAALDTARLGDREKAGHGQLPLLAPIAKHDFAQLDGYS